ncbi:hypothetical protein FOZ63_026570, partial [Perkinsus olseni]
LIVVPYEVIHPTNGYFISKGFPFVMVNTSLVRVTVSDFSLQSFESYAGGKFSKLGYTTFGYDPSKDRLTVVSTGEAYELVHSSSQDDPVGSFTIPSGKYTGEDGSLSVTMDFEDIDGSRSVDYHITRGGTEYSLVVKPGFLMPGSSLVQVPLLKADLLGLQSYFHGLTDDFYYQNLGYDPAKDTITLLLGNSDHITLVHAPPTTTSPPSSTRTPPSSGQPLKKPLDAYAERDDPVFPPIPATTDFLEGDRVNYLLFRNQPSYSFPTAMISRSLIKVTVGDAQVRLWRQSQSYGRYFDADSFDMLGYDAARNSISLIGKRGAYELFLDADKTEYLGAPTKPSGVYKASVGALTVLLEFSEGIGGSLARYAIKFITNEIAFTVGSPFVMLSSSLIQVNLTSDDLSSLHFSLAGLSTGKYYTTLGYDSANNVVTFVVENSQGVALIHQPSD